jgi:predicted molibdopterin-dependent oxidoreductase YjgC
VKIDLPFREMSPSSTVEVQFDGDTYALSSGMNLAAALLSAGVRSFRDTPGSGAERGPFCMMGTCFDCLVEIEGIRKQACMISVQEGMVIVRPAREAL